MGTKAMRQLWFSAAILLAFASAPAVAARPPAAASQAADTKGVVELEASGSADFTVQLAEDIASIIDDGATRRVLPVVGKGSMQNVVDLIALRGIDMAIVQVDVLDYAAQNGPAQEAARSLTYVTKLPDLSFHLLARPDIKSVADLANKPVSVESRSSGAVVTGARLFGLLRVPVAFSYDRSQLALDKLRKGEIAAIAFVGAKPSPIFEGLRAEDGFHFLSIPFDPANNPYAPASITAQDYPGLVPQDQPVETVAVGTALVVANLIPYSERYKNAANFVDAFFTQFQLLQEPGRQGPWRDVNLNAELPGWRRFPPAEQWVRRNMVASRAAPQDLKAAFSNFIDKRQQALGGQTLSQQQKDELFQNFLRWNSGQSQ